MKLPTTGVEHKFSEYTTRVGDMLPVNLVAKVGIALGTVAMVRELVRSPLSDKSVASATLLATSVLIDQATNGHNPHPVSSINNLK